jgi:hypothetical protein
MTSFFLPGQGNVFGNLVSKPKIQPLKTKKGGGLRKISETKKAREKREKEEAWLAREERERKERIELESIGLEGSDRLVRRICKDGIYDPQDLYRVYPSFAKDCQNQDVMKELYDKIANFRTTTTWLPSPSTPPVTLTKSCSNEYLGSRLVDFLINCPSSNIASTGVSTSGSNRASGQESVMSGIEKLQLIGQHRKSLFDTLVSSLISSNYDNENSARIAQITHSLKPKELVDILIMTLEDYNLKEGRILTDQIQQGIDNSLVPIFSRFLYGNGDGDEVYKNYHNVLETEYRGGRELPEEEENWNNLFSFEEEKESKEEKEEKKQLETLATPSGNLTRDSYRMFNAFLKKLGEENDLAGGTSSSDFELLFLPLAVSLRKDSIIKSVAQELLLSLELKSEEDTEKERRRNREIISMEEDED